MTRGCRFLTDQLHTDYVWASSYTENIRRLSVWAKRCPTCLSCNSSTHSLVTWLHSDFRNMSGRCMASIPISTGYHCHTIAQRTPWKDRTWKEDFPDCVHARTSARSLLSCLYLPSWTLSSNNAMTYCDYQSHQIKSRRFPVLRFPFLMSTMCKHACAHVAMPRLHLSSMQAIKADFKASVVR